VPMQKHFPKWLVVGLLVPLPTVLGCVLFIRWAALPRVSPLLMALVFAMLALGVLSCVMLPFGVDPV